MSYAKMTAARQRVGYTPATGRILLRRRVRGMLGKAPVLSLSSTGGTMTSTTAHITSTPAKQSWTAFELAMLAPFGVMLWYVATQPLVLHKESPMAAPIAEAPAAVPALALDPDAPVFVVGAESTLQQRIAPVARVTIEGTEPAAVQAAEPVVATPPVAAAATPVAEVSPQVVAAPQPVAPAAQPATVTPAQQAASSARIAITDGTGVDGLAKDIAAAMEQAGMSVAKTASLSAGSQRRTVIFYRDGFEEEARRLSRVFAQPPALVANTRPGGGTDEYDVRLVLGSAAARDKGLLARRGG